MIASPEKTKEILRRYRLTPKKELGQNFLIDGEICIKTADLIGADKETTVIEIGPGLGALTEELSARAKKVICYEKDPEMSHVISKELSKKSNIEIITKDFLKVDPNEYQTDGKTVTAGNLPFGVATAMITKMLKHGNMHNIYVMVQEEVARKIIALPGDSAYGSLSVLVAFAAEARYEFKVGRNSFFPRPDADGAMISLRLKEKDKSIDDEEAFLLFVRNIFRLRRKTLINNLLASYPFERKELERIYKETKRNTNLRAESLSVEEIKEMFKVLNPFMHRRKEQND